MPNKTIYCWVCDNSPLTGEGNLAKLFTKHLEKKYNPSVIDINKISLINNKYFWGKILNYKYILPFFGIIYLWLLYLKGKKCCYINYLPLWNFLIFLLLPPKTMLGPITGGALYKKNLKNLIIRYYLFNLLYFISSIILLKRKNKNLFFSTDLLKNKIPEKLKNKCTFNFVCRGINKLNLYNNNNNVNNRELLIYYKKHKNKENLFPHSLIKKLLSTNIKINVIGDRLNIVGIKNYGYVRGLLKKKIFKKSHYALSSNENIYTLFVIDSLNHNLKVIIDKQNQKYLNFCKERFLPFDFKKYEIIKFFASK